LGVDLKSKWCRKKRQESLCSLTVWCSGRRDLTMKETHRRQRDRQTHPKYFKWIFIIIENPYRFFSVLVLHGAWLTF
jgi:hypothetical protein